MTIAAHSQMSFKLRFEMFKQQSPLFSSVTLHKCNTLSIFLVFLCTLTAYSIEMSTFTHAKRWNCPPSCLSCMLHFHISIFGREWYCNPLKYYSLPNMASQALEIPLSPMQIWQAFEINTARFNQSAFRNFYACIINIEIKGENKKKPDI